MSVVEGEGVVTLRSIHVQPSAEEILLRSTDPRSDAPNGVGNGGHGEKETVDEAITLPQSTHSLLFTEPARSIPFAFAIVIVIMSYSCLCLALVNNSTDRAYDNYLGVPVQVSASVRGAQFLAILIALLMEEEIPSALYLLRMIPKKSLKTKFPQWKYWRFVFSALIRLSLGYIFLLNVFLVVIQATGVLDIFYDVLALQFVEQLDDIAFNLSKMDVLGKSLKRAATQKCFRAEFERQPFGKFKKMGVFLKTIYFGNLFLMISGLVYVSILQNRGTLQCSSITVTFGGEIWEDAVVTKPNGETEEMVLLYSYFNGVYKQNGTKNGRPIYREMRKFDNTPFEGKVGAEISYCDDENAWVFGHENIRKSEVEEEGCSWLLKSPETDDYNLLDVSGQWSIWTGVINTGSSVSIICDECKTDSDCNLNGVCFEKACECYENRGYFGQHCEHKRPCRTIKGERNDTWTVVEIDDSTLLREYGRPVYSMISPTGNKTGDNISRLLVYSGSRWFLLYNATSEHYTTFDEWKVDGGKNYHPFWDEAYTVATTFVSDPSTGSTPIGVDFFEIGDRGEHRGPFGVLHPVQEPPGAGYFRCVDLKLLGILFG